MVDRGKAKPATKVMKNWPAACSGYIRQAQVVVDDVRDLIKSGNHHQVPWISNIYFLHKNIC